ncbi:unnamed protein product [Ascophyllum nodosum]
MKTHVAVIAVASGGIGRSSAFLAPPARSSSRIRPPAAARAAVTPLMAIPLELEGQLDDSREWEVELELDGVTKKVTVPEGTSVLYAAKRVFDDPPCSCQNGICTTCAGLIREGTKGESYKLAVDALGDDQRAKGYTLTCQTYPCGPGLKVLLNQYDTVYEMQYGQYEVKVEEEPKKLFGMF